MLYKSCLLPSVLLNCHSLYSQTLTHVPSSLWVWQLAESDGIAVLTRCCYRWRTPAAATDKAWGECSSTGVGGVPHTGILLSQEPRKDSAGAKSTQPSSVLIRVWCCLSVPPCMGLLLCPLNGHDFLTLFNDETISPSVSCLFGGVPYS